MNLTEFLEAKPLYYDKIDYTRMPRVYKSIESPLNIPKIIHIIGTNGKGTSGRFLASALHSVGFNVGHYTSPHILEFNERVWLNAKDVSNDVLEASHVELQKILKKEDSTALSYFEYTTLLAMIIYKDCDYIVMEAGLGGEFDATAVFPKILTLVTPIALDHEAFLGSNIQAIATTKLNAIQNNAILAKQEDEVYDIANKMSLDENINIYRVDEFLTKDDYANIKLIENDLSLVPYLTQNLSLSVSALNFLKIKYKITDFKDARLFGRLYKISENITIDVGHNTLAAKAIVKTLSGNKYVIIYNSFKDKNYKEILEILKPITLHVEIIEIDDKRVESRELMQSTLKDLNIKYAIFKEIKKDFNYLVFGSFLVVEKFLREHNE